MRRAAKSPAGTRRFPNRRSASRIPMPLLPRILRPPTTPHGIIRRASETIAARVRTAVAIAAGIADAGGEDAGDAGVAEAVIAIAADVTAAQADEICLPRSTLRRRVNV